MNSEFAFSIERQPLYVDGLDTGKDAIIKKSPHQVLSVVGRGYGLVEHKTAIGVFDSVLRKSYKKEPVRSVILVKDGARSYTTYNVPEKIVLHGKDVVCIRLILQNSYDETKSMSIMLGGYRLVCSNGLVIGETLVRIVRKHTSGLDINSLGDKVKEALEVFKTSGKALMDLSTITIVKEEEKEDMMKQMIQRTFPKTYIDAIKENHEEELQKAKTVWLFYNVITSWLTHHFRGRFERWLTLSRIASSVVLKGGTDVSNY